MTRHESESRRGAAYDLRMPGQARLSIIGKSAGLFYKSFIFSPSGRIQLEDEAPNVMTVKLYPRMESLLRRCVRKIAKTARAPLWPALSFPVFFVASSGIINSTAVGAPTHRALRVNVRMVDALEPREPQNYLKTLGPGKMRLVEPVVVVRAPRPSFPEKEELARDPVAYAARMENGGDEENIRVVAQSDTEGTRLSVGGELLPEVSVSPYSRARILPEDVVMFFKDEKLDGLQGGIAYPAARLRFNPARPEVRASSSATYTSQ